MSKLTGIEGYVPCFDPCLILFAVGTCFQNLQLTGKQAVAAVSLEPSCKDTATDGLYLYKSQREWQLEWQGTSRKAFLRLSKFDSICPSERTRPGRLEIWEKRGLLEQHRRQGLMRVQKKALVLANLHHLSDLKLQSDKIIFIWFKIWFKIKITPFYLI